MDRWGVFLWNREGRYFADHAVRVFRYKHHAYNHADKLNAPLNDGAGPGPGEGYVVRIIYA